MYKNLKFQLKKKIILLFIQKFGLKYIENFLIQYIESKQFTFKGGLLNYFFHSYNNFGITERSLEIPIVIYYLQNSHYNKILEIGNVTKHYYENFQIFKSKDTLDKYENAYDVINLDIKNFVSEIKYDFIYSISTFEHMDTDGNRNRDYIKENGIFNSNAFNNIDYVCNNLLCERGKFVLTFPLLYCNDEIGLSFISGDLRKLNIKKYTYYLFYKISETEWIEINIDDYISNKYKSKFNNVNFLVVLEIDK